MSRRSNQRERIVQINSEFDDTARTKDGATTTEAATASTGFLMEKRRQESSAVPSTVLSRQKGNHHQIQNASAGPIFRRGSGASSAPLTKSSRRRSSVISFSPTPGELLVPDDALDFDHATVHLHPQQGEDERAAMASTMHFQQRAARESSFMSFLNKDTSVMASKLASSLLGASTLSEYQPEALQMDWSLQEAWAVAIASALFYDKIVTNFTPRQTFLTVRLKNLKHPALRNFVSLYRSTSIFWRAIKKRRTGVETIRNFLEDLPLHKKILLHCRLHLRRTRAAKGLLLTAALSRRHAFARTLHAINQLEAHDLIQQGVLAPSQHYRKYPFVMNERHVYQLSANTLEVVKVSSQQNDIGPAAERVYAGLVSKGGLDAGREATATAQVTTSMNGSSINNNSSSVNGGKDGMATVDTAIDPGALKATANLCFPEDATEFEQPTSRTLLYDMKHDVILPFLRRKREQRYNAWRGHSYLMDEYHEQVKKTRKLLGVRSYVLRVDDMQPKYLSRRHRSLTSSGSHGTARSPSSAAQQGKKNPTRTTQQYHMPRTQEDDTTIDIDAAIARIPKPEYTDTINPLIFPAKEELSKLLRDARQKQSEHPSVLGGALKFKDSTRTQLTIRESASIEKTAWAKEVAVNHSRECQVVKRCRYVPESWGLRTICHHPKSWDVDVELPPDQVWLQQQLDTLSEQLYRKRREVYLRQQRGHDHADSVSLDATVSDFNSSVGRSLNSLFVDDPAGKISRQPSISSCRSTTHTITPTAASKSSKPPRNLPTNTASTGGLRHLVPDTNELLALDNALGIPAEMERHRKEASRRKRESIKKKATGGGASFSSLRMEESEVPSEVEKRKEKKVKRRGSATAIPSLSNLADYLGEEVLFGGERWRKKVMTDMELLLSVNGGETTTSAGARVGSVTLLTAVDVTQEAHPKRSASAASVAPSGLGSRQQSVTESTTTSHHSAQQLTSHDRTFLTIPSSQQPSRYRRRVRGYTPPRRLTRAEDLKKKKKKSIKTLPKSGTAKQEGPIGDKLIIDGIDMSDPYEAWRVSKRRVVQFYAEKERAAALLAAKHASSSRRKVRKSSSTLKKR